MRASPVSGPPQVAGLAEVEGQVNAEVHQEPAAGQLDAVVRLRVGGVEGALGDAGESLGDDLGRFPELPCHVLAPARARRELRGAVADVAGAAEDRPDEVLQVAAGVQRQVAGGVGDSRGRPPQNVVVGEELDLAGERLQLAHEHAPNVVDQRATAAVFRAST